MTSWPNTKIKASYAEGLKLRDMEHLKRRALALADLIGFAEIPYSKAVEQASEELRKHFQNLDPQTQQEVMERIRGCFSD